MHACCMHAGCCGSLMQRGLAEERQLPRGDIMCEVRGKSAAWTLFGQLRWCWVRYGYLWVDGRIGLVCGGGGSLSRCLQGLRGILLGEAGGPRLFDAWTISDVRLFEHRGIREETRIWQFGKLKDPI